MRKICNIISFIILFAVTILTCVDVIGRYFLDHALNGTTELTEIGVAILVFTIFPFVCFDNEQIRADVLARFYSKKVIFIQNIAADILFSFGLFYAGQSLWKFAGKSHRRMEVSEFLEIPMWIIPGFISIICFITVLLLIYKYRYLVGIKCKSKRSQEIQP